MWGFKSHSLDPRFGYIKWELWNEVTNAVGEVSKTKIEIE